VTSSVVNQHDDAVLVFEKLTLYYRREARNED
jgi:hypothetical protein